ncbi:MAG TPA: hypothetical protein VNR89_14060 [Roseomonas sp.]|nr:hypothetical protein [Roseomonas sp.]
MSQHEQPPLPPAAHGPTPMSGSRTGAASAGAEGDAAAAMRRDEGGSDQAAADAAAQAEQDDCAERAEAAAKHAG